MSNKSVYQANPCIMNPSKIDIRNTVVNLNVDMSQLEKQKKKTFFSINRDRRHSLRMKESTILNPYTRSLFFFSTVKKENKTSRSLIDTLFSFDQLRLH